MDIDGRKLTKDSSVETYIPVTFGEGDIIRMELDLEMKGFQFYENDDWINVNFEEIDT